MVGDPGRLSRGTVELLEDRSVQLFFSAASAWEIAIKFQLGKLVLPEAPESFVAGRLARDSISSLPVEVRHGVRVATLPLHHRDPFDRILVVQAQVEGLTLLTVDPKLEAYDVALRRADSD